MLYNLREYHRPTDLDEALRLLRRTDVRTVALAGGVGVVGEGTPEIEAVVDLGGLGLDTIERDDSAIQLGATVRLQTIVEQLGDVADGVLAEAARRMAGWNVRNAATVGGALAGGHVHSPLGIVLVSLMATIQIYGKDGEQVQSWGNLASSPREDFFRDRLITGITIPLVGNPHSAYEQVGRTPADIPIVCAATTIRRGDGGQVEARIAVGGVLADLIEGAKADFNLDEIDKFIAELIPQQGNLQADFRGSAEYRRAMAPVLARRALIRALHNAGLSSD